MKEQPTWVSVAEYAAHAGFLVSHSSRMDQDARSIRCKRCGQYYLFLECDLPSVAIEVLREHAVLCQKLPARREQPPQHGGT